MKVPLSYLALHFIEHARRATTVHKTEERCRERKESANYYNKRVKNFNKLLLFCSQTNKQK